MPDTFIEAILKEMDMRFEKQKDDYNLDTIFFGGGTPSILNAGQLERIFTGLNKNVNIKPNVEITLESNPGTLNFDKLKDFLNIGINRLSIGVQSFNDEELKFLQRIHNSREAENAIKSAIKVGFDNINIDLIFSIPGQSSESLRQSLDKAAELNVSHIASYGLIYEEGTPLYNDYSGGKINRTDPDEDAEKYKYMSQLLAEAGYEHYEISNFAKNGAVCRHNINYWDCREYLAFGPAANGYINGRRYWSHKDLKQYISDINHGILPEQGSEQLSSSTRLIERIMLGLRYRGVDFNSLQQEFDFILPDKLHTLLKSYEKQDLVSYKNNYLSLAISGYILSDEIISEIMLNLDDTLNNL